VNRRFRILHKAPAALSLLLLVATVVLWVRSHRTRDRFAFSTHSARYTIHSNRGRLSLTAPPPSASTLDPKAKDAVARLKNSQFYWTELRVRPKRSSAPNSSSEPWKPTVVFARPEFVTPASDLAAASNRGVASPHRELLKALDDPDSFVAAHLLLDSTLEFYTPHESPKGSIALTINGLSVELLPEGSEQGRGAVGVSSSAIESDSREYRSEHSWRADPAQLPGIRDMWHDSLDVTVASIHHAWLALPGLLVSALWCARQCVHRTRKHIGHCPTCGYDLRATPDRCPECGAVPAPN
jgi:hypothetical protein